MRLIVLFTQNEYVNNKFIKPDDIILVSKKHIDSISLPNKLYFIEEYEVFSTAFRDNVILAKREFYNSNDSITDTHRDIVDANFSNLYNHIIGFVFLFVEAIKKVLLKYESIEEIILSDIIFQSKYMPYYEAEGEINRKLLYQSYDFIPQILYNNFSPEKRIHYFKKRSRLILFVRIFIRRYFLIIGKFIFNLLIHTKEKLCHSRSLEIPLDIKYVFLSRGPAHSHFFSPIYKELNRSSLWLGSDRLSFNRINSEIVESYGKGNYLLQRELLSFKDYVYELLRVLKYIKKVPGLFVVQGLALSLKSASIEMVISSYEVFLYKAAIKNLFNNYPDKLKHACLITGEMLTPYPLYIEKIAKEIGGISTLQMQTTLMVLKPQVPFVFCEKFVFKSFNEYDYHSKNNPAEQIKYHFYGSLLKATNKVSLSLNKVVFFTQPFENSVEFEIVEELVRISKVLNFQLYIKFHPRESKEKYKMFNNSFVTIGTNKQINQYVTDVDLAILRTSSIAQEIVQLNIPIVYCLLSEDNKRSKSNYLDHDYIGTIFNVSALESIFKDYHKLILAFRQYRNNFLRVNKLDSESFDLVESLKRFRQNA